MVLYDSSPIIKGAFHVACLQVCFLLNAMDISLEQPIQRCMICHEDRQEELIVIAECQHGIQRSCLRTALDQSQDLSECIACQEQGSIVPDAIVIDLSEEEQDASTQDLALPPAMHIRPLRAFQEWLYNHPYVFCTGMQVTGALLVVMGGITMIILLKTHVQR